MSSAQGKASTLEEAGWLAFGDMRGYVEPCGCDPKADLGGIQRAAVFLQRERALNAELFLFSLGNNLPIHPKDEAHKVPILLAALAELNPDAALFGRLEARGYSLDPQGFKNVDYVVGNLKTPSKYGFVKDHIKVRDIFVTGFIEPRDSKSGDLFLKFSPSFIRKWKKASKSSKEKVLLFDGSESLLQTIYKHELFDLIISANQRSFDKVVGPEEKENPRLLDRLGGKVRSVPVGGQGYLRGGVLLQQKAESLQRLLGKQNCKASDNDFLSTCASPGSSGQLPLQITETVTWLDKAYAVSSPLDGLYNKYQQAGAKVFAEKAKRRAKDLSTSPFVGSSTCKSCHPQAYQIWSNSRHAHALDTLAGISKDRDPECVGCHVLGYNTKGGFVNKELSPQFAHVNCENCHGPRKEHVLNPAKAHPWKGKATQVCTSCHHGTHTSNFQFDEYWPKISHGPKSAQKAP